MFHGNSMDEVKRTHSTGCSFDKYATLFYTKCFTNIEKGMLRLKEISKLCPVTHHLLLHTNTR